MRLALLISFTCFLVLYPLFKLSPLFSFAFSKYISLIFFGILLLLLLSVYIYKAKIELPGGKIVLYILGFLAITLISAFFSLSKMVSIFGMYNSYLGGFISLIIFLIFYYFAFILRKEKDTIVKTMVLGASAVSVIGIFDWLYHYLKTGEFVYRISSTLGQPNRLAFFELMIIPIGLSLLFNLKGKEKKLFYIVNIINFFALMLTFTRAAYIVVILISLIWFFYFKGKDRLNRLFFLLMIILLFFGIFFSRSIPFIIRNYSQSSVGLRLAELQSGWDGIISRGILRQLVGYGPDTTYLSFFRYKPAVFNQSKEEVDTGAPAYRNNYLEILSTLGVVGLAFYFLIFAYFIKSSIVDLGIFFSLLAMGLYSFFYYNTETTMLSFWVLGGLVTRQNHKYNLSKAESKIVALCLIVIAILLFIFLYRIAAAEFYIRGSHTEKGMIMATQLTPWQDEYWRIISDHDLNAFTRLKNRGDKRAIDYWKKSESEALTAIYLSPHNIRNLRQIFYVYYTAAMAVDKKYQKESVYWAKRYAEEAPQYHYSYELVGLAYLDQGDLLNAKKAFIRQNMLKSDSPVYLHLAEVAKQQGNWEEALIYYRSALRITPTSDKAREEVLKLEKIIYDK